MNFPTAKDLKSLAKACRAAGITHFKCNDFEVTVGEKPETSRKSKTEPKTSDDTTKFETDSLNHEDLLFWSTGGLPGDEEPAEQIGS